MVIGWELGRGKVDGLQFWLQASSSETATCSIPVSWVWAIRNQWLWAMLTLSMLGRREIIKEIPVLMRLPCSLGPQHSLNWVNGCNRGKYCRRKRQWWLCKWVGLAEGLAKQVSPHCQFKHFAPVFSFFYCTHMSSIGYQVFLFYHLIKPTCTIWITHNLM